MKSIYRIPALLALVVTATQLVGCASINMNAPKATTENVAKLRGGPALAPAAVSRFALAPGLPASVEESMSIRGGNSLRAPNSTFSQYLKESLRVELEAAGLFDQNSPIKISGELTESSLDSSMSTASGILSARFVVTRDEAVKYNRVIQAKSEWPGSFVGAVAIPEAAGQYERLYRKLVGQLFEDAEFKKALSN